MQPGPLSRSENRQHVFNNQNRCPEKWRRLCWDAEVSSPWAEEPPTAGGVAWRAQEAGTAWALHWAPAQDLSGALNPQVIFT